jgi:hypothetical protein
MRLSWRSSAVQLCCRLQRPCAACAVSCLCRPCSLPWRGRSAGPAAAALAVLATQRSWAAWMWQQLQLQPSLLQPLQRRRGCCGLALLCGAPRQRCWRLQRCSLRLLPPPPPPPPAPCSPPPSAPHSCWRCACGSPLPLPLLLLAVRAAGWQTAACLRGSELQALRQRPAVSAVSAALLRLRLRLRLLALQLCLCCLCQ